MRIRCCETAVPFLIGQASLQILQAVNGLLLVWLLSVSDFAVYTVFIGAMGFASQMIGFGLGPTLSSCVGQRFANPYVVGRYLRAAIQLRLWTLAIVSPIGVALLWYSGQKAEAASLDLFVLSICLLGANYLSAQTDLFQTPLKMHRKLDRLYRWTAGAELFRLILLGTAYLLGYLNLLFAGLITVVGLTFTYYGAHREGRPFFSRPTDSCALERRELLHLTLPTLPNVIFGALQGQIVIFMAALFGSTGQIAAVGALGRLARLLTFLTAANQMIVGPAVARHSDAVFWKRVPAILAIGFLLAAGISASGFLFPESLVYVLGRKYEELTSIIWLVTLNAGLTYLTGVIGTLRSFRRWVAWWASFTTIAVILVAQGIVIALEPLDTLIGVLLLSTAASCARLLMLTFTMGVARYKPTWLRSTKSVDPSVALSKA